LTCPNCGGVLEETFGGELGCMPCLVLAGIDSEEEVVQDSTLDAFEGEVRFGMYEIDCHTDGNLYELGRGAMGVTYRATDTSLQRKVALKLIKTEVAERSADAREGFVREARVAAALRHKNIATVYQFAMRLETGQYFCAMESSTARPWKNAFTARDCSISALLSTSPQTSEVGKYLT
jgi:Protein kinase domain